jgi:hypothetical protein
MSVFIETPNHLYEVSEIYFMALAFVVGVAIAKLGEAIAKHCIKVHEKQHEITDIKVHEKQDEITDLHDD